MSHPESNTPLNNFIMALGLKQVDGAHVVKMYLKLHFADSFFLKQRKNDMVAKEKC